MIALIDKYFPDLTRPQRGQFEALYALYADWNTKINVITTDVTWKGDNRKRFTQRWINEVIR